MSSKRNLHEGPDFFFFLVGQPGIRCQPFQLVPRPSEMGCLGGCTELSEGGVAPPAKETGSQQGMSVEFVDLRLHARKGGGARLLMKEGREHPDMERAALTSYH